MATEGHPYKYFNVIEARIQTGGGFLQLGRNNFSPRETTIKRVQLIDVVSYTRGNHSLKFGADLNFDRVFNFFPGLPNQPLTIRVRRWQRVCLRRPSTSSTAQTSRQ